MSSGPYATLNLSLSVGDDQAHVLENRRRLAAAFGAAPGDFVFARQVAFSDGSVPHDDISVVVLKVLA